MRPKLLQLAIENKTTPKKFEVVDAADVASIYVYDILDDDYGISAQGFVEAINSIKAPLINLRVNSGGGDVFAARAMVAAIAAHPSRVVAYIDGVAASAASYLAMACDEVVMADGSFFMIHDPWSVVMGSSADMRGTADLLDKIGASIASDYERKSKLSNEEIVAMMAAETWLDANEAVARGFADRIATNEKGKSKNAWNLSAYANAPKPEPDPEPDPLQATRARMLALLDRI